MEKRVVLCGIVLFGLILLWGINLPPYEEVFLDDTVEEQQEESENSDYEPHITVHLEKIVEYSFPRNGWIGMEVADVKYIDLMSEINANRDVLTASKGRHAGPSGQEVWYNLPMEGVINIMRESGYDEINYPYWIRDDGCKMLGDYIMVAANLDIRSRGNILETSLGIGLVCDKCEAAYGNDKTLIDIATNW